MQRKQTFGRVIIAAVNDIYRFHLLFDSWYYPVEALHEGIKISRKVYAKIERFNLLSSSSFLHETIHYDV